MKFKALTSAVEIEMQFKLSDQLKKPDQLYKRDLQMKVIMHHGIQKVEPCISNQQVDQEKTEQLSTMEASSGWQLMDPSFEFNFYHLVI